MSSRDIHNFDNDDGSTDDYDPWISTFCALFGHDYFVEVAPEFIEDDFNLTGLSSMVPYYKEALDTILDFEPESSLEISRNKALYDQSAELLYGLIHARYILTKPGLQAMADKYEKKTFGVCSRYYCDKMHLIPVGRSDVPCKETVRLYCPCCSDIYLPSSSRYLNIDGAFFGTTFPGLFMKMFSEIDRQCNIRSKQIYELKLFGFKISDLAPSGPRMKWLRQKPISAEEIEEFNTCEFDTPSVNGDSESDFDDNDDETMASQDD